MQTRRVLALLERGRGIDSWSERFEQGEVSERVPYGYQSGSDQWTIAFSTDQKETGLARFVRRAALRLFGFDLVHVWRHRQAARDSDVIWTHTEHVHLAYTLLRVFVRDLPPALSQSIWLPADLPRLGIIKRKLFTWLLSRSDVHVVQSELNARLLESIAPGRLTKLVLFGVSSDIFVRVKPGRRSVQPKMRILGVGNDRHRNWDLLAEAADQLMDIAEFRILTRTEPARPLPANVTQSPAANLEQLIGAYEWADLVCLPLLDNQHASGITVALETVYAGRPLLMTDAGGLDAYFPEFRKYALPADSSAVDWAMVIRKLYDEWESSGPAMRAAAERDVSKHRLDSAGYSSRLLEVSRELLDERVHT